MKKLNSIRKIFIYALIPALFMSNYPNLIIGKGEIMNYELTMPIIWLAMFFFVSLPFLIQNFKTIFLNRKILLTALLPAYATLSLLWTSNFLRGFLTVGLLWLIFFATLSIFQFFKTLPDKKSFEQIKTTLLKIFFISATVASIICWLQCILDVFGIRYSYTALCEVCTSQTFGFPHPNGLAIEPQYMGNLLLAPALLALFLLSTGKHNDKQKIHLLILSILFGSTIFLTLSRGAIFAYCISFVILTIIIAIRQHVFLRIIKNAAIAIAAFALAVTSQGIFSELSPVSIDFFTGISVYINQLSLGIIDLKALTNGTIQSPNNTQANDAQEETVADAELNNSADFDGYIEASTDVRTTLSAFSIDLWSKKISNLLFGVGYGGAGTSLQEAQSQGLFSKELYNTYPAWIIGSLFSTPKQIVQNEYVSILLELGIIGFILCAIIIIIVLKMFKQQNKIIYITSLLIAYGVTLFFLSGFTNVFHMYLLIPVFYFVVSTDSKKLTE